MSLATWSTFKRQEGKNIGRNILSSENLLLNNLLLPLHSSLAGDL